MDTVDIGGLTTTIVNSVAGIASGGTAGTVLKLVLLVLLAIAAVWAIAYLDKKKKEQAHTDTEAEHNTVQAGAATENAQLNNDLAQAEQDVDAIFKPKQK